MNFVDEGFTPGRRQINFERHTEWFLCVVHRQRDMEKIYVKVNVSSVKGLYDSSSFFNFLIDHFSTWIKMSICCPEEMDSGQTS